jgi:hypothetical protein
VALEISDPAAAFRYLSLRGRVVAVVEEGAPAQLEALSPRYLARPSASRELRDLPHRA